MVLSFLQSIKERISKVSNYIKLKFDVIRGFNHRMIECVKHSRPVTSIDQISLTSRAALLMNRFIYFLISCDLCEIPPASDSLPILNIERQEL